MRKIIHIDMDCFFAAVEMREQPALRDIPMAVGGTGKRGVLCTANYAARAFGVRAALATGYARKLCPNLVVLPGRMALYKSVSQQVMAILQQYSTAVEPVSLDEAYLDVTESHLLGGSATRIAEAIRAQIFAETGLTASAGVAPVKFLAKIASDLNKPNGLAVITPQQVPDFIASMPLKLIPGVGKKTSERLMLAGLVTGSDVLALPQTQLVQRFGRLGELLYLRCHGIDERPIASRENRKSLSVEHTYGDDLTTWLAISAQLPSLLAELGQRVTRYLAKHKALVVNKISVKLKFHDFQQTTLEQSGELNDVATFSAMLLKGWQRGQCKAVRLLGVGVSFRLRNASGQLSLLLDDSITLADDNVTCVDGSVMPSDDSAA